MKFRTALLIAKTVIVALVMVGITACNGKKEQSADDAVGVETEVVSESDGAESTGYVGEIEAATSTACSFPGTGTVLRVLVTEGQHVSKGQLIATLDPTQSRNALAASQAVLTQAQDAYKRMKTLHEQNSLSDMDWVEVQSKVSQAQASVDMARKSLRDCNLVAPCAGVIGSKSIEPGMTALPAQPVCNILQIGTVKVKVSIPEKEIGSIKSTTGSQIYVAALGRTFRGGRIEKGVEADALSRTYDIRINVSNHDGALLPGMVANVTLNVTPNTPLQLAGFHKAQRLKEHPTPNTQHLTPNTQHPTPLITVPVRSVQQSADGKNFVWVVRDRKSYRQDVTLGETIGNRIAVTSGLKQGEKVIVAGYQKVSEGHGVQE